MPATVFVRAALILGAVYMLLLTLGSGFRPPGSDESLWDWLVSTVTFALRVGLPIGIVLLLVVAASVRANGATAREGGGWDPEPLRRYAQRQLSWAALVFVTGLTLRALARCASATEIAWGLSVVFDVAVGSAACVVVGAGALRVSLPGRR